ncbi:MAG: SagB/ThcOx family dehydrogenase [Anaerolineales bacterium]|jgi:SagB-type dehydrogenase family enzyme
MKEIIHSHRELLKCDWWTRFDEFDTDQQMGEPRPEIQKPVPPGARLVDLVSPDDFALENVSLKRLIQQRRSQRYYSSEPLNLEELSFLLWATQGISQVETEGGITYYMRVVPSGGNRHPFETYLSVHNVTDLDVGLYRYLPLDHKLVQLRTDPEIAAQTSRASLSQSEMHDGEDFFFVEQSAVTFIWTAIPYRTEWRYGPAAAKLIAVDAGHLCQNLYLACDAINAGTVAVGAFDRIAADAVLGVDGEEEFTIYMAPVGKVPK